MIPKKINLSPSAGEAPISAKKFEDLVNNFNKGDKELKINYAGYFILTDKTRNHDEQKLFKKIGNFFLGKKSAETELKKQGREIEKRFPELGRLILHIEKSQRKTGLGVSNYMKMHSQDIEKELAKSVPSFNVDNFSDVNIESMKFFFKFNTPDDLVNLCEERIFESESDQENFKNGFAELAKYVSNPLENSLFKKGDFQKIKDCKKFLDRNIFENLDNAADIKHCVMAIVKKIEELEVKIDQKVAGINESSRNAEQIKLREQLRVFDSF